MPNGMAVLRLYRISRTVQVRGIPLPVPYMYVLHLTTVAVAVYCSTLACQKINRLNTVMVPTVPVRYYRIEDRSTGTVLYRCMALLVRGGTRLVGTLFINPNAFSLSEPQCTPYRTTVLVVGTVLCDTQHLVQWCC